VSVPSLDDPSMAPAGCSTLYVLEPVPNLDGKVDWSHERARVRDDLAARVSALGYPADVEVEELVDPTDWERQGMERGTPFALSHKFWQTGPFRPGNVDKRAPGLVLVGSGTVPGVGVPMVLISGRLAAQRVSQLR
jgi:phytoene desaturase